MAIGDNAKKDLALMQTVFPLSVSKIEEKDGIEILNNVEPYHLLMAKVSAGKRRSIFAFSTSPFSATLIIGCASNDASENKFQNMRYEKWKTNSHTVSATGSSNNKK